MTYQHNYHKHRLGHGFLGKGRNRGSDRKGGNCAVADPRTHDISGIDRANGHTECSITTQRLTRGIPGIERSPAVAPRVCVKQAV